MKFYAWHKNVLLECAPKSRHVILTLLLAISLAAIQSIALARSTKTHWVVNNYSLAKNFTSTHIAVAANMTIKGKVVDENNQPLPGVTVRLRGTSVATSTDITGNFKISVPAAGGILDFNFIGYSPFSLPVNTATNDVKVAMKPTANDLTEVVVVAYSTQKKINLTGAVSTINADDIVASPVANISNALVGNAPGLSALQAGGEPGKNQSTIYIRGQSTFNGSTTPLIVIDGIEQPAEQGMTQLNSMDANEIASISILKDAASTSVYGIRAANGVIIITTKRGTTGKPSIGLSTNFGYTTPTLITPTVNSYEYALLRNQAINILSNDFNNTSLNNLLFTSDDIWKFQNDRDYTPAQVAAMTNLTAAQQTALNNSPALYYGSADLYKEVFDHTGPQKQYNFTIRGGTDKVKYFTSLGYYNQGNILGDAVFGGANVGSTYNRYNFRSNFDIQSDKNTTISINLAGQFGTTSGGGLNSATGPTTSDQLRYKILIQTLLEANPFVVPAIINGNLTSTISGVPGSADNPLGLKDGGTNPVVQYLQSGTGITDNTLLSGSIKVLHRMDYLLKGLSISATANYDDNFSKFSTVIPSLPIYSVRRDATNPNNLLFYGGALSPTLFDSYPNGNSTSTWHKVYYDAGINYAKSFGGSNITALVIGKASTYSIPVDAYNTPSGIEGFAGRVTYNYRERYLAEANLGYNGTANFAPGKRFGTFPAFSAGWVATNESFFPKNQWVSFLKLRGSFGLVGNDQINGRRFLYLPSTYVQNQSPYYLGTTNGSVLNPAFPGTAEAALGNPDVTWEKSTKYNAGLDASFFNYKLTLTVDAFKENRNNILATLGTIPATFGVAGGNIPPVNVGITTNHGYEVTLGWNDKINSDLSYGVTSFVSYARNKVIYKSEAPNPYSWQNQTGQSIGQYFGLVSNGFFNTPQELADRPYNTLNSNVTTLGDIRYIDINGDGKIDSKDMVPIGYSNLPQYAFSGRLNIRYKAFDLSVLFNGTANGSFYVQQNLVGIFYKDQGNAFQWIYDGAWSPQKVASGATITYPRPELNTTNASGNFLSSDFWLKSNNFVKLKNIEVGYTVPSRVLNRLGIASVRFYANGNNVYIFKNELTKFGIDPETTDSGQPYTFPITRVLNFGTTIRF